VISVGFPHIAVLVPCYNEEVAIPIVVRDFRKALPEATIYVYNNNSQERTIKAGRAAGAVIGAETLQGKDNVVRRMFADIEADVYVLVDGDGTYDGVFGNMLLSSMVNMIFGNRCRDVLSGYRVLSRRFVKSFPALAAALFLGFHMLNYSSLLSGVGEPQTDWPSFLLTSYVILLACRFWVHLVEPPSDEYILSRIWMACLVAAFAVT
jgi:glycosyltransferase involved in cell wall biosynthesis